MINKLKKLVGFVIRRIDEEQIRLMKEWKEYSEEYEKAKSEYDCNMV